MLHKRVYVVALVAMVCIAAITVSAGVQQRGGQAAGGQRGAAAPTDGSPNYNSAAVEKTVQIKPELYFIYGGGANAVIRVTPEGLILADTKNPGAEIAAAFMAQIKAISSLPIKYVLNTHHHPDHVGNNQMFIDQGATVVALQKLKELWASDARVKDIPGQPTVTFAKDYTLRFGGTEVQMHYYGSSHTDGDTIIYFPDRKFVMVSDTVPIAPTPGINGTAAVQVPGLLASLMMLDFDSALPGRGPVMTRAEIEAYKKKWDTFIGRAKDAVKAGATKETLMSQVKQDDLGWAFNAGFFTQLYEALLSNPNGEPRQGN